MDNSKYSKWDWFSWHG